MAEMMDIQHKNKRPYIEYPSRRMYGQIRTCLECNNKFIATNSNIEKGYGKYCSWECRSKLKNNGHWKNGKSKDKSGYIRIMDLKHPHRDKHNYILEHRLIIEKQIGRHLHKWEYVHHINKIIDDNRPENLMAFNGNGNHNRFERGYSVKSNDIIFDGRKLKMEVRND